MTAQKGSAFLLKIGDGGLPPTYETVAGLRTTQMSVNGDTVVVTLRRDGGDGAGDREPRTPVPPRLAARPPLDDEGPTPLERALPPLGRTREDLADDATVLRFERPAGDR